MQIKKIAKIMFSSGIVITGFSLYEAGSDHWIWGIVSAITMAFLLLIADSDDYITIPENMNVYIYRALSVIFCTVSTVAAFWFKLFTILGVSIVFLAVAIYPSFKVENGN